MGTVPCLSNERKLLAALALALIPIISLNVALAVEPYTPADHPFWMIDEVRGGVFKQSIDNAHNEGSAALNLEVLGGRFAGGYEDAILNFLLTPRSHLGTTIAFGKTDEFYWGLTWDAKITDAAFLEASFGGAAHDGPLDTPGEASYGCQVNFRESASLGFALDPAWRIMTTIDHMSNGGLCQPNRGLTNAGIRLGYRW